LIKNSKNSDSPPPEFDVQWSGDLTWMTLTWHIKAPAAIAEVRPVSVKKPVSPAAK
jgi:hypothetical protein